MSTIAERLYLRSLFKTNCSGPTPSSPAFPFPNLLYFSKTLHIHFVFSFPTQLSILQSAISQCLTHGRSSTSIHRMWYEDKSWAVGEFCIDINYMQWEWWQTGRVGNEKNERSQLSLGQSSRKTIQWCAGPNTCVRIWRQIMNNVSRLWKLVPLQLGTTVVGCSASKDRRQVACLRKESEICKDSKSEGQQTICDDLCKEGLFKFHHQVLRSPCPLWGEHRHWIKLFSVCPTLSSQTIPQWFSVPLCLSSVKDKILTVNPDD